MLELNNLSLDINGDNGKIGVLNKVNFKFEEGKLYVLTGPNGGGKTSLAKAIMGIYKITSGKIILDGQDITNLDITDRAKKGIGYAFQQPPRFKGITVEEIINLSADKENKKGCSILYDVGLCPQDYISREIDQSLSGGELKRIEISTLLSRNCKISIFDEPEAGIDLWSFAKLTETFKNIHNKSSKNTIIIISHQERILDLADEILLIANGTVEKSGKKDDILPSIMQQISCSCRGNCVQGDDNDVRCSR